MATALPGGIEDQSLSLTANLMSNGSRAPGSRPDGYPEPYIIEPTTAHTHTAILLHGLGSNGPAFGSFFLTTSVTSNEKYSPYSRPLNVLYPTMKWVFPTASWRRSTRFGRIKLSSWFDVFSIQDPSVREETQIEGLVQSTQYLRDLIAREMEKLNQAWGEADGAEKRIVFGGLSQGCAISLATLLSLDYGLGGWVGMSGFMPMRQIFKEALDPDSSENDRGVLFEEEGNSQDTSPLEGSSNGRNVPEAIALNTFRQNVLSLDPFTSSERPQVVSTPVFYGHGSEDEKVACKLGNELVETLKQLDMNVRHQIYHELGHWIRVPEEIDDMISVFTKNGAWPDHVDRSNTPVS